MITLRFVLGHGWASRVISLFSAGHLSHVDVVMPDGRLLGARSDNVGGGDGVLERPNPYEPVSAATYFQIAASPEQQAKFYDFLQQQLGKPYDHLAIFAFAIDEMAFRPSM